MSARRPDAGDGLRRFIRNWLTFNEDQPPRLRTLWRLLATVALLLAACALLLWLSGQPTR